MKIKNLIMTLVSLLFLTCAYSQDSTGHKGNRDSMRMHRSDTGWKGHNNNKNLNHSNKMDSTMKNDRMTSPAHRRNNGSPKVDSLKR